MSSSGFEEVVPLYGGGDGFEVYGPLTESCGVFGAGQMMLDFYWF